MVVQWTKRNRRESNKITGMQRVRCKLLGIPGGLIHDQKHPSVRILVDLLRRARCLSFNGFGTMADLTGLVFRVTVLTMGAASAIAWRRKGRGGERVRAWM